MYLCYKISFAEFDRWLRSGMAYEGNVSPGQLKITSICFSHYQGPFLQQHYCEKVHYFSRPTFFYNYTTEK